MFLYSYKIQDLKLGSSLLLLKDGFCLFKKNKQLEKYDFEGMLNWVVNGINNTYELLESTTHILTFQINSHFTLINNLSGESLINVTATLYPKYLDETYIWGSLQTEGKCFLTKYSITKEKFILIDEIPNDAYLHSIYNNWAVFGNKANFDSFEVYSLTDNKKQWEYNLGQPKLNFFKEIIFLKPFNRGTYALDLSTGKELWQTPYYIDNIDHDKGLMYSLGNDFVVLDAQTGKEMINIKNWKENQKISIGQITSPFYIGEDFIVVSACKTEREYKIGYFYTYEGGIFFINKQTAEIVDFFELEIDSAAFKQIELFIDDELIPVDQKSCTTGYAPVFKNNKLYITLPSEDKKTMDLYIFEKEVK